MPDCPVTYTAFPFGARCTPQGRSLGNAVAVPIVFQAATLTSWRKGEAAAVSAIQPQLLSDPDCVAIVFHPRAHCRKHRHDGTEQERQRDPQAGIACRLSCDI